MRIFGLAGARLILTVVLVGVIGCSSDSWHGEAEPLENRIFSGKVTAFVPKNWRLEYKNGNANSEVYQWIVPYLNEEVSVPTARCAITIKKASGETPQIYSNNLEQFFFQEEVSILRLVADGEVWRTAVVTQKNPGLLDFQMVGLENVGVHDGIAAALILSLPVERDTDEAWLKDRVKEFNWLIKQFAIGGSSQDTKKVDVGTLLALREQA